MPTNRYRQLFFYVKANYRGWMAVAKKYLTFRVLHLAGIILLSISGIVFYAILFAGCTSTPGISNVYLLQLSSQQPLPNSTTTPIVRINLFGICAFRPPLSRCWTVPGDDLSTYDVRMDSFFFSPPNIPLPTANTSASTVQDGKGVLSYASSLQAMVTFPWLMVTSSLFFLLGVLLAFSSHGRGTKGGRTRIFAFLCFWPAFVLALIATICSAFSMQGLALTASVGLMDVGVRRGGVAFAMEWLVVAIAGTVLVVTGMGWKRGRREEVRAARRVAVDGGAIELGRLG